MIKVMKEKTDRVQKSTPHNISVEQRSINGELRGPNSMGQNCSLFKFINPLRPCPALLGNF